ncbi:Conserved WD40 repeat-containing protein [Phaffia rhodozyma]|uniref:Conserved WD40 repeat-containing protein n=1 Tax=Phaffia rhodozyma TaxID=264483 RepID=A0A0F7SJQ2_PHARH|nr:Conserved WD40 repeat-containing protein [Phaffia rhodozyma]
MSEPETFQIHRLQISPTQIPLPSSPEEPYQVRALSPMIPSSEFPPSPSPLQSPFPFSNAIRTKRPTYERKDSSKVWRDPNDTFNQQLAITVKAPVGSMSISPAHRDVVLAARQGLYIIDLEATARVPRFLPQGGLRVPADVQWSPHSSMAHSIVSTSAQKLLVWNLGLPSEKGIEREVEAHTRAVSDVNWAVFHPQVVATAGIDGWVKTWDIRTTMRRDSGRVSAWGWGSVATQARSFGGPWPSTFHDNKVLIWDQRMGSIPVTRLYAHSSKIYGIDWSRENGHEMVTCSLDKTVKVWNIHSLNESATTPGTDTFEPPIYAPTPLMSGTSWLSPHSNDIKTDLVEPDRTIRTNAPVFRARFLPFGRGILSLPQAGETSLEMRRLLDHTLEGQEREKVITRFEGHTDKVKEFVWRIRGGENSDDDDRSFQLITWGTDHQLRFWPISESVLLDAGHKPHSPIKVIMTRRGAPSKSYIDEPDLILTPPSTPIDSFFSPLLTSSSGAPSVDGSSFNLRPMPHVSAPLRGMNIINTLRTGNNHQSQHHQLHKRQQLQRPRLHHVNSGLRNPMDHSVDADETEPSEEGGSQLIIERSEDDEHGSKSMPEGLEIEQREKESRLQKKRSRADNLSSSGPTARTVVPMTRGTTFRGPIQEPDGAKAAMNWNNNIEAILPKSGSRSKSNSVQNISRGSGFIDEDSPYQSEDDEVMVRLETELKEVIPIYKREIKVETFDLAGRKLVMSLQGPWGAPTLAKIPTPTFIRIGFTFPTNYPKSSSRPFIDTFEMKETIPAKDKARLKGRVKLLCDTSSGNCMYKVMSFLLGYDLEDETRGRRRDKRLEMQLREESSDSSDDDDDSVAILTSLSKQDLQRPCGATFGPNGELVTFFGANPTLRSRLVSQSRMASKSPSQSKTSYSARSTSTSGAGIDRPLSHLSEAMLRLSMTINSEDGRKAAPMMLDSLPSSRPRNNRLQIRELPMQPSSRSHSRTRKLFSIQIHDASSLTISSKKLAERYWLSKRPAHVLCQKNKSIARSHGRKDHEVAWKVLEELLTPFAEYRKNKNVHGIKWTQLARDDIQREDLLGMQATQDQVELWLKHFSAHGDFQMLATMLCVLRQYIPPIPDVYLAEKSIDPQPPSPDYFTIFRPAPPVPARYLSRNLLSDAPTGRERAGSPQCQTLDSPCIGQNSSKPPANKDTNSSSWSILNLNSGFNMLGSYGSGSVANSSGTSPFQMSGSGMVSGGLGEGRRESVESSSRSPHRSSIPELSQLSTSNEKDCKRNSSRFLSPGVNSTSPRIQSASLHNGSGINTRPKVAFSKEDLRHPVSVSTYPPLKGVEEGMRKEREKPKVGVRIRFEPSFTRRPAPISHLSSRWLSFAVVCQRAYADLLLRWGLIYHRTELLKVTFHIDHLVPVDPSKRLEGAEATEFGDGLGFAFVPPDGEVKILKWRNKNFKPEKLQKMPTSCAYCGILSHGVLHPCLRCGHVLHLQCARDYFLSSPSASDLASDHSRISDEKECPAGCGCICYEKVSNLDELIESRVVG